MKKLLLILIVLGGGYYYFQGNDNETVSVSQLIESSSESDIVNVKGKVKSNFKLIYGLYELFDEDSGESVMVSTKGALPKVGTIVIKRLKRNDVMTFNDKTFSLFEEVD